MNGGALTPAGRQARQADVSPVRPASDFRVRGQSPGSGSRSYPGSNPAAFSSEPDELFGVAKFWQKVKRLRRGPVNEEKARELFREADASFLEKEYRSARGVYQAASETFPNSSLQEDSLFMIAECYFFEDRYPKAYNAYGALLEKYANTRHLDAATGRLFSIAKFWQESHQHSPHYSVTPNFFSKTRPTFDTSGNARKVYETIWLKDPTGPLADHAMMQVANSHFLASQFDDADLFYTQLRTNHPNSRYLIQAYLLGIQAKLNKYQGPAYDRKPLDEAEQLIETLLSQFADQLGPERERVMRSRAMVRAQQAEREWTLGEFYAGGKHHRAAGIAYQKVIDDYPDTKFAEMAAEEMQAIAGLPPEPPKRLSWLVNLFPSKAKPPIPLIGSPSRPRTMIR